MNLKDFKLDRFEICPGRFYLAMWFYNLPKRLCPEGAIGGEDLPSGDVTSLAWRLDSNPAEWVYQWRFRYYFEETAWGKKDKRTWYAGDPTGSQEEVFASLNAAVAIQASLAGSTPHCLVIKGGVEKFLQEVERQRPFWFSSDNHTQLSA
jgi:hypothetical protein